MHCVDLGESFPTHPNSNAYFLAKFGFDTADNEPSEAPTPQDALIWSHICRTSAERVGSRREAFGGYYRFQKIASKVRNSRNISKISTTLKEKTETRERPKTVQRKYFV